MQISKGKRLIGELERAFAKYNGHREADERISSALRDIEEAIDRVGQMSASVYTIAHQKESDEWGIMSQSEGHRLALKLMNVSRASMLLGGVEQELIDESYNAVVEAIDGETCERVRDHDSDSYEFFYICSQCKYRSLCDTHNYCPRCGSQIVGDSDDA